MQRVNDGQPVTGPSIAEALEVVVANIGDPSPELSLLGTEYPQWVMAVDETGGSDLETLYRLDLSADAVNAPYILPSALPGYRWSAICGYAQNQAAFISGNLSAAGVSSGSTINAVSTITAKTPGAAGIALDPNAATGNFTGRLSTVPVLTGNRRYLFPNIDMNVVGSNGVLTSTRVPFANVNGLLVDDSQFTYNGTTLHAPVITTVSFTASNLTPGRVPFIGVGGLFQDSPNLTFDGSALTTVGGLSVGSGFVPSLTQTLMRLQATLTDPAISRGADFRNNYTPSAPNVQQNTAFNAVLNLNATAGLMTAPLALPNAAIRAVASVTAGDVQAIAGMSTTAGNAGAGTVALIGLAVAPFTNSGGGTVPNAYGVRIEGLTVGTLRVGVQIEPQTGGTTNYAIRSNAGLTWLNDATVATASTVGALVIGDAGTPGTNVGIGGGRVIAGDYISGAQLQATGSGAQAKPSYVNLDQENPNRSRLIAWGPNNVTRGNFDIVGASSDGSQVTVITRFRGDATVSVFGLVAAASSITGSLIVGDGVTAATNVGIGGGVIHVGKAINIAGSHLGTGISIAIRHDGLFNQEGQAAIHISSAVTGSTMLIGTDDTNNVAYIQGMQAGTSFSTRPLSLQPNGGLLRISGVSYQWPFANAAGALTNDGAGNLSWTAAGVSAVAAFWAGVANSATLAISAAGAASANRMHVVDGTAGNYDITLPVAPAAGTVVGLVVREYAAANKAYRLDAGAAVIICGRTRYLTLVYTNVALLYWDGTRWQELVLETDTQWINAGAITVGGTTTAPTKGGGTTIDRVFWRRAGDAMDVRYEYKHTTAGTAGSGFYLFSLPFGVMDSTRVNFDTAGGLVTTNWANTIGTQGALNGAGVYFAHGGLSPYDATRFRIFGMSIDGTAAWIMGSTALSFSNAQAGIQLFANVPIVDW